jgi:hypothetical protein
MNLMNELREEVVNAFTFSELFGIAKKEFDI